MATTETVDVVVVGGGVAGLAAAEFRLKMFTFLENGHGDIGRLPRINDINAMNSIN